jgi:hypothetical protein
MSDYIPFTGRCACGDITYSCNKSPLAIFNCHCKQCQAASGGTFVSVALVKEAALTISSGRPKYYRSNGDSNRWTERGFCSNCGTPMFAKGEVAPGLISIKPGTLDDASWYKPTIDTWASTAPEWLCQNQDLPKTEKTPNLLKPRVN